MYYEGGKIIGNYSVKFSEYFVNLILIKQLPSHEFHNCIIEEHEKPLKCIEEADCLIIFE